MNPRWFYLDAERHPVPTDDLDEITSFMMQPDRRIVAKTLFAPATEVSTMFMIRDQRIFGDGPPLLFETAKFGPNDDCDIIARYATWDDAAAGHAAACRKLREQLKAAGIAIVERELH